MKKIITFILIIAFMLSTPMTEIPAGAAPTSAAPGGALAAAETLYELGLFRGVGTNADGSVDFALEGAADRQTAVTMMVRLIGREAEALGDRWQIPFTDYDAWAGPYIGYAYNRGLTVGTGAGAFSGAAEITAQQYITLMLRCLGYSDKSGGDFTYATACDFAEGLGLTDGEYTSAAPDIVRGDIAVISLAALNTKMKGSDQTLLDYARETAEAYEAPLEEDGTESPDMGEDLGVIANSAPAVSTVLEPVASGAVTYAGNGVTVDASNTRDGYIMVRCESPGSKLKVIVYGPATNYTYDLNNSGEFEVFPLSDGNGAYSVGVYKNISGTRYSTLYTAKLTVALADEFAPFLRPNQYVNFDAGSAAVARAAELASGAGDDLDKVSAIYYYVIGSLTYDSEKAATVQSGYLPDVDEILALKKGICFDYAALMAAMLRSVGVPAKLVIGYAGTAYHAWISVYTETSGWIEAAIYFDGYAWKLMDPTFASCVRGSSASHYNNIMAFIGDGSNYSAKYLY